MRTDANEGECRLSYNAANDTYQCIYRIRLYQEDYQDTIEVKMSDIRAYYGEAYGSHKKGDRITLDNTAEGLMEVLRTDLPTTEKFMRDGVLYIRRGNEIYTITGLKVGVD